MSSCWYSIARIKERAAPFICKELCFIKIRTKKEIEAFQATIDQCSRAVWLVSPRGEQYNLKSDTERYLGIARLIGDDAEEMELFTSGHADEMVIMDFYSRLSA